MSTVFQNPQPGPSAMTRMSFQAGWLMYANPDIQGPGRALVLHGEAVHFELSQDRSMYGNTVDARFMMAGAVLLTGRPMDQMVGDAIQAYPGNGRELPPQIKAMRELARRHADEYRDLCYQFGLPSLVVMRDAWVSGLSFG